MVAWYLHPKVKRTKDYKFIAKINGTRLLKTQIREIPFVWIVYGTLIDDKISNSSISKDEIN